MSRLPSITGKEMIEALGQKGFAVVRIKEVTTASNTRTGARHLFW